MNDPNGPDPLDWLPDAPATTYLLQRGRIERVQVNVAHANAILADSRRHLVSASDVADGIAAAERITELATRFVQRVWSAQSD